MAYRNRRYGKKHYGKKKWRSGKKKISYVKKTVRRALASRGLSKPELKHMRYESVMQPVNTDFAIAGQSLLPYLQGVTGYQDFVGKKVTAKAIYIRGMFYNSNEIACCVRLFIVEDLEGMASSDLYLKGNPTTTSRGYEILDSADFHSLYNDIQPRRFKVLYDKLYCIPGLNSDGGGGYNRKPFFKKISLGNAQVSYAQSVLTASMYPVKRNYLLFIVGDDGLQQTVHVDLSYTDV